MPGDTEFTLGQAQLLHQVVVAVFRLLERHVRPAQILGLGANLSGQLQGAALDLSEITGLDGNRAIAPVLGNVLRDLEIQTFVRLPGLEQQHFLLAQPEGHPHREHHAMAMVVGERSLQHRGHVQPVACPRLAVGGHRSDFESAGRYFGDVVSHPFALPVDDVALADPCAEDLEPAVLVLHGLGRDSVIPPAAHHRADVFFPQAAHVFNEEAQPVQASAERGHDLVGLPKGPLRCSFAVDPDSPVLVDNGCDVAKQAPECRGVSVDEPGETHGLIVPVQAWRRRSKALWNPCPFAIARQKDDK